MDYFKQERNVRLANNESDEFVWIIRKRKNQSNVTWEDRFEEIKQFKATNGHCKVTRAENKELSQWVSRQRSQYGLFQTGKKCALSQQRIGLLDSIEFVWNIRKRKNHLR